MAAKEENMSLRKLSETGSDRYEKGTVKRKNMFSVPYSKISVEKGFNIRDITSEASISHINSIFETIMAGGEIDPLLLRVKDGKIVITDGHCTHAAYGKALKVGKRNDGTPIDPTMLALEDTTDDHGRVLKMLTAGQALDYTPLEIAIGYKRLQDDFGDTPEQIAASIGRSKEGVKLLLILANADKRIHDYVKANQIGAYEAVDMIKEHGDKAADVIAEKLAVAQANGKTKITKAAMEGRAIPKKIVTGLVSTVQSFTSQLSKDTRKQLVQLENATPEELKGKTVLVDAAALLALLKVQEQIDADAKKKSDKVAAQAEAAKQTSIL